MLRIECKSALISSCWINFLYPSSDNSSKTVWYIQLHRRTDAPMKSFLHIRYCHVFKLLCFGPSLPICLRIYFLYVFKKFQKLLQLASDAIFPRSPFCQSWFHCLTYSIKSTLSRTSRSLEDALKLFFSHICKVGESTGPIISAYRTFVVRKTIDERFRRWGG